MSKRKNSPNHGWQKSIPGQRKDVKPWFHQRKELELKLYQAQMLMGPPSISERHYAKELIIRDGIAVEVKGDSGEQGCEVSKLPGSTHIKGCDVVSCEKPKGGLALADRIGSGSKSAPVRAGAVPDLLRPGAVAEKSGRRQKAEV